MPRRRERADAVAVAQTSALEPERTFADAVSALLADVVFARVVDGPYTHGNDDSFQTVLGITYQRSLLVLVADRSPHLPGPRARHRNVTNPRATTGWADDEQADPRACWFSIQSCMVYWCTPSGQSSLSV